MQSINPPLNLIFAPPHHSCRHDHDIDEITPAEPTTPLHAGYDGPSDSPDSPSATRNLVSSRGTSSSPSGPFPWLDESPKQPIKPKKGLLSFLTIKEPSTSAWLEFAQQNKAETELRGAKPSGSQTQKLPETVPPVNSKWDGLPSTATRSRSGTLSSWKRSIDTSHSTAKHSGESYSRTTSSHSSSRPGPANSSLPPTSHQHTPSQGSAATKDTSPPSSSQNPPVSSTVPDSDLYFGPTLSNQTVTPTNNSFNQDADTTDFKPAPDLSLSSPTSHSRTESSSQTEAQETVEFGHIVASSTSAAPNEAPAIAPSVPKAIVSEPRTDSPTLPTTSRSGTSFFRSLRGKSQPAQPQPPPSGASSGISATSTAREEYEDEDDVADAPDVPRARNSQKVQYPSSEQSMNSSPSTLATPQDSGTVTPQEVHPSVIHSRKRSTENAPQWPLPQTAAPASSVPTQHEDDAIPPPVPPKSARRLSASSFDSDVASRPESLNGEPSVQQAQLERALPASPSSPSAPAGSNQVRSFSRPLPRPPNAPSNSQRPMPMGTISIVRDSTTYTPSNGRAPPAFLPGRVLTKDSDLATIPESDTTSLRTVSAIDPEDDYAESVTNEDYRDSSHQNTMYLDTDTESEFDNPMEDPEDVGEHYWDEDYPGGPGSNSQQQPLYMQEPGQPRYTSEESWLNLSPRERLGLGGSIRKQPDSDPPWSADQDGSIPGAAEESDGNGGRRSSLIKVFKRN